MKKNLTQRIEQSKGRYLFLLFFLLCSSWAMAQTVSGIVKSGSDDQPLIGATVTVKGTTKSTAADGNGHYTIAATQGATLVFKSVGYLTLELKVGPGTLLNATLTEENKSLNEVVVIGYGTQKKGNVSGALSTLKNENLDERAITRVDQALVGQLAGVTVRQNTGIPGKAFSVQVRGSGSISAGNEPLYVIDGFPLTNNSSNTANGTFTTGNPLDNINPNDIDNIEVLKDAAAAAIYGSRASNGVVLITTKRGKVGAARISFNSYVGYNQASKKLSMLNGDEWIANATEVINAQYLAKYPTASVNDDFNTRVARVGSQDPNYVLDPRWSQPGHVGLSYVDWQDVIERKGQMENTELSASGGTNAVNYFVSGNFANQDGFIIGVGYKAYSLRANVEVNASKHLKLGLNIAPTYSITQDPGVEGQNAIFHQAISLAPVQETSSGDGLYPNSGLNPQYIYSGSNPSPLGKLQSNLGTTKRYRTLGTIYAEYELIKGLSLRSSVNLDNTDNIANTYVPYYANATTLTTRVFNGTNNLLTGTSGSYNSYRRQTFVNENTLNYSTIFNHDHSLNLLTGVSYNYDRLDRTSMSSNGGYTSAIIQTLNAAAAVTGNTTSTLSILESYFARVQYAYKDKYLLSASIRSDGSSRFGINNQYGVFPSASIAWRVSQEGFMKAVPTISDLKLRFSYGVNGNNNIGDYDVATIGSAGYVFGSTPATVIGQYPNVIANPNLKWERSQTYDGGLDFGVLDNRIVGSFDYYNKLNTDLLLNVPTPEVTSVSTVLANIGAVRNIGEELEITSRNLVGKFQWNTTVNITHNTNKVEALGPGQTQIIITNGNDQSDAILRIGSPLNSIYALRTIGFLTAADIANGVARYGPQSGSTAEQEGDLKYQDTNGDGVITEADKQVVGHPTPDYTFGVTNTFRFKGFDLSVLVQGQQGGSIYSQVGRALNRPGQGRADNHTESFVNRWESPTNQGAGRFGKTYATYYSPITAATDWLYSSDYIRVRDITLGYNLKSLIKTPVVQGARIYITLENFFGADKYTDGLNPDAQNQAVGTAQFPVAGDYGGLPLAKSLIFGLNFTF